MPSSILSFRRLLTIQCFSLLASFGIIFGASEWLIRNEVNLEEPFAQAVELFWRTQGSQLDGAIFGSSELARGLLLDDPKFINFALGGEHLGLTQIKVKSFFAQGHASYVVLPATGQTLRRSSPPINDAREKFFDGSGGPRFLISMNHHQRFLLGYWRKWLVKGSLKSTATIRIYGGQVPTEFDTKRPLTAMTAEERFEAGSQTVLEMDQPEEYKGAKAPVFNIYSELISLMQNVGTQICLLQMPYAPIFTELSNNSEWLTHKVPEIWMDFAKANGVTYINLINQIDETEKFRDPTHLNRMAGELHSKAIVQMCFPDIIIY